jgi:hypothetical protein
VLQVSVKCPYLYRPENWLVRQLINELKPVYEEGLIRKRGKATVRTAQQSLETSSSLLM